MGASIGLVARSIVKLSAGSILAGLGVEVGPDPDWFAVLETPIFSSVLLKGVAKVLMTGYLMFLSPIYEEWLFRGALWVKPGEKEGLSGKITRIGGNAAVYGLTRLVPIAFFGMNGLFVLVAVVEGLTFAILREISRSRIAPTTAHIINDSLSTLSLI